MMFPLVVGLGNPGAEYDSTRHNFGFMVVERWATVSGASWKAAGFANALLARTESGTRLLKPLDYVNRSGVSVSAALSWFKLQPEQTLVVVDDVNLPLGRLRLRAKGSAGGHNGLKSVAAALGTEQYARLRGGVGAAAGDGGLVAHVLGKFADGERKILEEMIVRAVEVLQNCQHLGLDQAAAKIKNDI
ncbi:MAG: aminoacyl-tRNA hydrolase [Verrucomicrobiales bacterium]|jgi:PTH1 family peptidyl-tRNA hydrolase|nr:aminoacyl-tRNA hydrolase [Verrucomicrobiales bacterium]